MESNFFTPVTETFFGIQSTSHRELCATNDNKKVIFLGVPCDLGGAPGCSFGPHILREFSKNCFTNDIANSLLCIDDLSAPFYMDNVFDIGDIEIKRDSIDAYIEKIYNCIINLPVSAIPFSIGGDHTFTYPLVQARRENLKKPVKLVHIDNHLDVQLCGNFRNDRPEILNPAEHSNFISWVKHSSPDVEILQVGIRAYQSVSSRFGEQVSNYLTYVGKKITNVEMITHNIEDIFARLPMNENIYLSIDVDVLHHVYLTNTGHPAPLGIPFHLFFKIINFISKRNTVVGVDIMEFGTIETYQKAEEAIFICYIILEILKNILHVVK